LIHLTTDGHRLAVSSIVLYEWLRGPRLRAALVAQEELFPRHMALPFGPPHAALAAELYDSVRRPRGREIDLAIAAVALVDGAALWTLNRQDFSDIPDLRLI
jgi:predicted nucleic acid-binding protein